MSSQPHPFDPLSPKEIAIAIRAFARDELITFRVITLAEPPKKEMIAFLEAIEANVQSPSPPKRVAKVHAYYSKEFHKIKVDIQAQTAISNDILHGRHSHVDSAYMKQVEEACHQDPRVQAEIQSLQLPKEATVIVEPWTYATDGMNDMNVRITMCWFYMRLSDHSDANYYAYPLDIIAEVSESLKVTKVSRLPSGVDEASSNNKPFDSHKIHTSSEYHPDLQANFRETTRPLQIFQPDGPSFQIDGNFLSWEKWTMRVGFNYREGLTLHNVQYDGRSLFYRLSLSEMFVPYGDPRCPYPRKGAFDLGNDGAGVNANNLKLGCDCLGHVKYFNSWHVTSTGDPLKMPNVVCCHEIDDGILWKHTNFRSGDAVVTRSRLLVLQTIITVSNYEYCFLFYFGQDASIHYEARATGILSTAPIGISDQVPYGTVVAPGVLAPYHQHLFCLRIDPSLGGHQISVVSKALSEETGLDLEHQKNRVFKIVNEGKVNPITGTPVGFKLLPCYSQMLLAHPSSYHSKRSEFGAHAVWVTRHSDEELFASGEHTMQSLGGEGIASWIKSRRDNEKAETGVRNEDIVVWHTFGSTHNPRIEDWPVMPCEKMVVGLKPVNFFDKNPGLDVPISTQEKNRSVLQGTQGAVRECRIRGI
ncbi:copper amine oxidase [Lindgomyces ingoldianus]|uniref:Copper amine oxidase n=1 Tax=Lindgomyces ingoldianus TaxID=673940 RepID=A0ACB6QBM4_9PLEO|nr:copper amine oxidase [Lindgomyces ingoldianus]KAF2463782.1 copper amine oxidase [Lindgomyces ingoldianus]